MTEDVGTLAGSIEVVVHEDDEDSNPYESAKQITRDSLIHSPPPVGSSRRLVVLLAGFEGSPSRSRRPSAALPTRTCTTRRALEPRPRWERTCTEPLSWTWTWTHHWRRRRWWTPTRQQGQAQAGPRTGWTRRGWQGESVGYPGAESSSGQRHTAAYHRRTGERASSSVNFHVCHGPSPSYASLTVTIPTLGRRHGLCLAAV
jgi:hypothetical protein